MSIVAVTSLIFAAIFAASSSKAIKDLADMQKKYQEIVRDVNGPTITGLIARRQSDGFNRGDLLLDVAIKDRDDLAKWVGGQDAASAQAAAKTAATTGAEAMKAAGLGETSTSDNLAGTVTTLANALTTLHTQNLQLVAEAKEAKESAAKVIKDTQDVVAAKDKEIAASQQQAADANAKAEEVTKQTQGVTDSNQKVIEEQAKKYADDIAKTDQARADAERAAARYQKENSKLEGKLDLFRPNSTQSLVRQADGAISRINPDGTVYINLGAGQQIVEGMTFEVYDKVAGVPPLKNDDTSLPIGKGSIEVLRIGANTSECRILQQTPGRTITEGDIIANLIYDRNTKLKFVIFGKFDITKPGIPDAADSTILKRLVTEWGATLQPDLAVDTDFLVIGSEPKVPDFTEEQRRDPVNAKTLADAQAEVDRYRDTLNRAKDMSIPVLNQNRFLYYVGYFYSARR
jgi:hypothetical protein